MGARPVPYQQVLDAARESGESAREFLERELPLCWEDRYKAMSERPTQIVVFRYGTFDYIFDSYQQPAPFVPGSGESPVEARLIAAIGTVKSQTIRRDDVRLRGITLSPAPGQPSHWDRGHYIAHSLGGTVDGNEANVFLQLRSVNRGRYRSMELYCKKNPGILCFSRPLYTDTSAHPCEIEFGVLKTNGELWVELLPNRPCVATSRHHKPEGTR